MSFGIDSPNGMTAEDSLTSAPWTGQVNPYQIASGYANNIFPGDLVGIQNGMLVNYYDLVVGNLAQQRSPAVGVFMGCDILNQNTSIPGSGLPGSPYWPAGTLTLGGENAVAYVMDDPSVEFTIQAGHAADTGSLQPNQMGKLFCVGWTVDVNNIVQGNFSQGSSNPTSSMYMSTTTGPDANNYRPLVVKGPDSNSTLSQNSSTNPPGTPYPSYWAYKVLIANHNYRLAAMVAQG